jgi:hypothetical protein
MFKTKVKQLYLWKKTQQCGYKIKALYQSLYLNMDPTGISINDYPITYKMCKDWPINNFLNWNRADEGI